jgi:hypothetical protein
MSRIEQPGTLIYAPSYKAHADPCIAGGIQFAHQPSLVTITIADKAKATGPAYRRGKAPIGNNIHWRERDRVLDL